MHDFASSPSLGVIILLVGQVKSHLLVVLKRLGLVGAERLSLGALLANPVDEGRAKVIIAHIFNL